MTQNQGLGLAISTRTYIQNFIPKFENLFGKELKSIKTPMCNMWTAKKKGNILVRFEPTNLRIVYIKNQ
jgi:hypothetical protein